MTLEIGALDALVAEKEGIFPVEPLPIPIPVFAFDHV